MNQVHQNIVQMGILRVLQNQQGKSILLCVFLVPKSGRSSNSNSLKDYS